MIHQKDGGQVGKTISHYKILEKLGDVCIAVLGKNINLKLKNIIVVNFYRFLTPLGVSCL